MLEHEAFRLQIGTMHVHRELQAPAPLPSGSSRGPAPDHRWLQHFRHPPAYLGDLQRIEVRVGTEEVQVLEETRDLAGTDLPTFGSAEDSHGLWTRFREQVKLGRTGFVPSDFLWSDHPAQ